MFFGGVNDVSCLEVLRCIWLNPGISRNSIARLVGVDQSTVSRMVSTLLNERIVETVSKGESGPQGGRRPVFLRMNPGFGCVAGIEMQSEEFTVVGINLLGEILFHFSEKYTAPEQPIPSLFFNAYQSVRTAVARAGIPLLGIGVGVPGIVNGRDGIIIRSNPLEIREPLAFTESIAPLLPVPLQVEHDVRCCCWAELAYNKARCPENFAHVLGEFRRNTKSAGAAAGVALGLGFVFGHRIYAGEDFSAGEFRSVFHNVADTDTLLGIRPDELAHLRTDPSVQDAFGHELGKNLALIVNVLNLRKVVISGSITELGPALLDRIRGEVELNWLYQKQGTLEVAFTPLGNEAVAYGAAGMLLEQFLVPPENRPGPRALIETQNEAG